MRRSVALICQLLGKSSGFAWAMRWRMIAACGLPDRYMACDINVLLIESLPRASLEATRGVPNRSSLYQLEVNIMGKTLPPFSQLIEDERRRR